MNQFDLTNSFGRMCALAGLDRPQKREAVILQFRPIKKGNPNESQDKKA